MSTQIQIELRRKVRTMLHFVAEHRAGIADTATILGLPIAIVLLLLSLSQQRSDSEYGAWQAIMLAHGKPGNLGRVKALEQLSRNGVDLSGVSVTGETIAGSGAHLPGLHLRYGTNMERCQLYQAVLVNAQLSGVDFSYGNLWAASLRRADLSHTKFRNAILDHAYLVGTILRDADLTEANLSHAILGADCRRSSLINTNLRGAYLGAADLQDADLLGAVADSAFFISIRWDEREYLASVDSGPRPLSRKQLLSLRTWRGACLPVGMKDLEIPIDAPDSIMEHMGRIWPEGADLTNYDLRECSFSARQLKRAKDWRGTALPAYLKQYEVPPEASTGELEDMRATIP